MVFQPPAGATRQVGGIDFSQAVDFAIDAKMRFDTYDQSGTADPNKCKALQKFPNNQAVFWSSKMAICTDGPAAGPGHRTGSQLDPNPGVGQNETAFKPFTAPATGLPSETVPYIVLPKLTADLHDPRAFDPLVALGDVAIVVFKEKIAAAICGDLGPNRKIGEASIRVHEILQSLSADNPCPDPCPQRDSSGFAKLARNSSVDEDVLFFVFPNSAFKDKELSYENIETMVAERAFRLFNALRSS